MAIARKRGHGDPRPRSAIVVGSPKLPEQVGEETRGEVLVAYLQRPLSPALPKPLDERSRAFLEEANWSERRPLGAEAPVEHAAIERKNALDQGWRVHLARCRTLGSAMAWERLA
jgi:hypothetical protein